MNGKQREKKIVRLLMLCALILFGAVWWASYGVQRAETSYVMEQRQAAELLTRCFSAVRGYKEKLHIPMSQEDYHQTGMIGPYYTGITTTLGAIEAKRTTAWPDMGALCVRLLYEAGVRPGDRVAAGFSGSFPAMNLAVMAACQSMKVEVIPISSVGASTYGATDPELTFPEMLHRLVQDGVLTTDSAAVTLGGDNDTGDGMLPEQKMEILERLEQAGLVIFQEPKFLNNLEQRQEIYERQGPIQCFVSVGGNVTSMGVGERGIALGQGVLDPRSAMPVTDQSGLVERYLGRGIPVVHLLNIKQLTAEYGLPYDPVQWPDPGSSAVYYRIQYPLLPIVLGLLAAAGILCLCTESCRLHLEDTGENCKIRSGIYEEGACPQDKPPPRRYFAHLLNILLSTYSAGHPWSACRAWTSALQRNAPAGSLPQS